MSTYDAVVVGAGHNGLVAAAYLARAGWSVCVLERNDVAGGCVLTEELTRRGYRHDTMSSWHPLFHLSAAYADLGEELAEHGLSYRNTDAWTTAAVRDDGAVVLAHRDPATTAEGFAEPADRDSYLQALEGFGAHIEIVGELLATELVSLHAARLTGRLARRLGTREGLRFAADAMASTRSWVDGTFTGREPGDLYGPWVLHTGLDPDAAGGGFITLAILGSLHQVGLPIVEGGSSRWVDAMVALIERHGGVVRTGTHVGEIVVRGGRASAVRAGGEELVARRAIVANVTPTQLYGKLLPEGAAPAEAREQARRFRYNRRAGMQIHVALSAPLRFRDARLAEVPLVHFSDGVGATALSCAQAANGLLPARPTVALGQQHVLDPSRVPEGGALMWIQLQEVPYAPRGDAADEIEVGPEGWTDAVRDAYTERVLDRIRPHVENLDEVRLEHVALPPTELERRNVNLERGDIYSGDAGLDQSYLWRPLPGFGSHATPIPGLHQCGASTYPGPGLNAASGRVVAQGLLDEAGASPVSRLARGVRGRVAAALR